MILHTIFLRVGVAVVLLTAGCAGSTNGYNGAIRLETDPPGAMAFSSGRKIGSTPLSIHPNDYFTARAVFGDPGAAFVVRYVGILSFEKAGCEPHDIPVDDNVLSQDIHVTLKCTLNDKTPVPQPGNKPVNSFQKKSTLPVHDSQALEPSANEMGQDVEHRLTRLESLHKKGLLTDEEYRSVRKRILDAL